MRQTLLIITCLLVPLASTWLLLPRPSFATEPTAPAVGAASPQVGAEAGPLVNLPPPPKRPGVGYLGTREFALSGLVFVFGLVSLGLGYAFVCRCGYTASESLRLLLLQLIVIGTLFCITAGFSGEDIAPAIGLYGTIVGYLLGRSVGKNPKGGEEPTDAQAEGERR